MKKANLALAGLALTCGLIATSSISKAADLTQLSLPDAPQSSALLPDAVNPRRLELSLSQRKVSLIEGDEVIKSYPVAVGRPGWETPVGEHKVQVMYKNPPWQHWDGGEVVPGGDPYNPLGTRWIGFWKGKTKSGSVGVAGFHGTTVESRSSVGTAASSGCVRMYKEDIEELFDLVEEGMVVNVIR